MFKGFSALAAGGLLLGLLGGVPAAIAAQQGNLSTQQGTTSGPAVGTNVKPSTAVEKNAGSRAAAVGAPGMEGQPGNKNGPPPKHHAKTHHRSHKHTTASKNK